LQQAFLSPWQPNFFQTNIGSDLQKWNIKAISNKKTTQGIQKSKVQKLP
jgi:hypothetical protein